MSKLTEGCATCRYGNVSLNEMPCYVCSIRSEKSRWAPINVEESVSKAFEAVQDELVSVGIAYAKKEIDIDQALDWYRQILEQSSADLLDDEDEEELMDGDLETVFERLMEDR